MLRMPRTYGFGVQSPFAYAFIREVVNCHSVSHSCIHSHVNFHSQASVELVGLLRACIQNSTKHQRRYYSLLVRLIAYAHPDVCFVSPNIQDKFLRDMFISMGFKLVSSLSELERLHMAVISFSFSDYDHLLDHMESSGMLVVLYIHQSRKAYDYWKFLISDKRCFVSFDLYDIGVIFFDSKMYKRNYCCNF